MTYDIQGQPAGMCIFPAYSVKGLHFCAADFQDAYLMCEMHRKLGAQDKYIQDVHSLRSFSQSSGCAGKSACMLHRSYTDATIELCVHLSELFTLYKLPADTFACHPHQATLPHVA